MTNKEKQNVKTREKIIDELMDSYGEYLEEFSQKDLETISNSLCFTLREAEEYHKKYTKKGN